MWKRIISLLLLLGFCVSYLGAQSPLSSVERIQELLDELDQNLAQQAILIETLQTSNEQASAELNEALRLLKESEESLRRQIALSENLGWLIEDQATYQRLLEKKLTFWRIISGMLATSLITTIVILATN
ncbi:MAG: hypothetical protein LBU88_00385 [Treponema sp.]|jgi:cell shape-determining protein MreC|nr:hypothetical protein [Treponema sp.]